uniref:NADH dehydrogenase subunit 6 n=1 Tax=Docophoroides brevis TaxID=160119 RepID=UPI00211E1A7A|nr:NADH dehydrogenase subunit 6 [Docophoroides brevis]UTT72591.1 NADH dehydrogenase subunit 6 [Docophoroides brevis]
MNYIYMFAFLTMFMVFWFTSSSIIELLALVICTMMAAIILYSNISSPWLFYLMSLPMVGGLMVLMSFVIIIQPKPDLITKNNMNPAKILITMMIMIIIMQSEVKIEKSPNNESLAFHLSNIVNIPFLSGYLVMIIVLLYMLLVINSIIKVKSGSMINPTSK